MSEFTNEFLEWARTHPTDVSAIGLNILIDHIDESHAKIAQLEAERDEWHKDAERLATILGNLFIGCILCNGKKKGDVFVHDPDCPITLHRQLVEKYEVTE